MHQDAEIVEDARERRLDQGGNTRWNADGGDTWFVYSGKIPQSVLDGLHTGVQLRLRQNYRLLCRIVNRSKCIKRRVVGVDGNPSDTARG